MAARSKAQYCGRSPAEIMSSNPTGGMECRMLSGRGLCDELITRPEEFYRLVRRCVKSRNLVNEKALVHWGLLRQKREEKRKNPVFRLTFVPFFLFTSLQYSNTYFLLFVWRENFFFLSVWL